MKNDITLRRENIKRKLLNELDVIKKCFLENDETFESKDNFNKFILFSMYRGIEDCINALIEERIKNGPSKKYCEIINDKLQSKFIDSVFLELMIKEITNLSSIKYSDIMTYINENELSTYKTVINDINDITNYKHKATDVADCEFFIEKYNNCKSNRNRIMHSVVANGLNTSRNAVIYSFIVYAYLMLVLENVS